MYLAKFGGYRLSKIFLARDFSLFVTTMIESKGIGARSVRFPNRFFVSARPARENERFELRAISMYDAVSSHSTI